MKKYYLIFMEDLNRGRNNNIITLSLDDCRLDSINPRLMEFGRLGPSMKLTPFEHL